MTTILERFKRALIPKNAIEALVCLGFMLPLGWLAVDFIRCEMAARNGTTQAKADILRGVFMYHNRGKVQRWHGEAVKILERDFGIHVVNTPGGCLVGTPDSSFDKAYNHVATDFFQQKFGFDPVEKVIEEARSKWMRGDGDVLSSSATGGNESHHNAKPTEASSPDDTSESAQ